MGAIVGAAPAAATEMSPALAAGFAGSKGGMGGGFDGGWKSWEGFGDDGVSVGMALRVVVLVSSMPMLPYSGDAWIGSAVGATVFQPAEY